jgi:hypothetical protein
VGDGPGVGDVIAIRGGPSFGVARQATHPATANSSKAGAA